MKTKEMFKQDELDGACDVMRALAHPLRLRILQYIEDNKPEQVKDIYNNLKQEQSIVSQHLRILINS